MYSIVKQILDDTHMVYTTNVNEATHYWQTSTQCTPHFKWMVPSWKWQEHESHIYTESKNRQFHNFHTIGWQSTVWGCNECFLQKLWRTIYSGFRIPFLYTNYNVQYNINLAWLLLVFSGHNYTFLNILYYCENDFSKHTWSWVAIS